jgi:hypothetical protein
MIRQANEFKMRGYNRLTKGDRTDVIDMRAIKKILRRCTRRDRNDGGESFMQDMMGKGIWQPAPGDEACGAWVVSHVCCRF